MEVKLMDATSYSNFRQELKKYFKQVNENSDPLIVTNKNPDDDVVVIGKSDYEALIETLKIQSNSYLMDKIYQGDAQFRKGKGETHNIFGDAR
jgi:antitoxin YefM